jgi:ubiquinone/menaquinone biosynthesis C-methylase UbiE
MNKFEYFLMTFSPGRHIYLRGIVRQLRDISQLPEEKVILEIGCGNGVGTTLIHQYFRPARLIATELSPDLVKIFTSKNRCPAVVVEEGDASNLQFKDNQFDAVIGLSVIHHIPKWKDCIDELYRVMKPGAMLILKELSIDTFETPLGRLARCIVDHPYDVMFKKANFLQYTQDKGFRIIDCRSHSIMYTFNDFFLVAAKADDCRR